MGHRGKDEHVSRLSGLPLNEERHVSGEQCLCHGEHRCSSVTYPDAGRDLKRDVHSWFWLDRVSS